jgi:hypothetical protein
MQQSKFGNALGTIGAVGGVLYSIRKQKSFGATALFAVGFGILGLMIGNSITKFYE